MTTAQPIPLAQPIVAAAAEVAKPPMHPLLKPAVITLVVWQVLIVIMLLLSGLQISQLTSDLTAAKQQVNLMIHYKQINK